MNKYSFSTIKLEIVEYRIKTILLNHKEINLKTLSKWKITFMKTTCFKYSMSSKGK
jgi:hypothetical protein